MPDQKPWQRSTTSRASSDFAPFSASPRIPMRRNSARCDRQASSNNDQASGTCGQPCARRSSSAEAAYRSCVRASESSSRWELHPSAKKPCRTRRRRHAARPDLHRTSLEIAGLAILLPHPASPSSTRRWASPNHSANAKRRVRDVARVLPALPPRDAAGCDVAMTLPPAARHPVRLRSVAPSRARASRVSGNNRAMTGRADYQLRQPNRSCPDRPNGSPPSRAMRVGSSQAFCQRFIIEHHEGDTLRDKRSDVLLNSILQAHQTHRRLNCDREARRASSPATGQEQLDRSLQFAPIELVMTLGLRAMVAPVRQARKNVDTLLRLSLNSIADTIVNIAVERAETMAKALKIRPGQFREW
jgi:hypothetical protein